MSNHSDWDHNNKKPWYKSHPDFEKLLDNFFNQVCGISRDLYKSNYGNNDNMKICVSTILL